MLFFGGLQRRPRRGKGFGVGQAFCVVVVLWWVWLSLYDPGVEWVAFVVRSDWLTLLYVSFLFFYKAKVCKLRTLEKKDP